MVNDEESLYKNIIAALPLMHCMPFPMCVFPFQRCIPAAFYERKTGKTPFYKTLFSRYKKQSFASCLVFSSFPPLYPEAQKNGNKLCMLQKVFPERSFAPYQN